MIQSTVQAPPKIKIPSVQPEFWESIGVFPDALGKNRSGTQIATENKKKLTAIAKPELAALCDHFQIPYAPKNQADDLAAGLLTACDPNSIMCLLDFVKRKSEFISRTFQRLIPSNTKTALVSHLSRIHLKPLTESRPARTLG